MTGLQKYTKGYLQAIVESLNALGIPDDTPLTPAVINQVFAQLDSSLNPDNQVGTLPDHPEAHKAAVARFEVIKDAYEQALEFAEDLRKMHGSQERLNTALERLVSFQTKLSQDARRHKSDT